jgi:hypothetical protein
MRGTTRARGQNKKNKKIDARKKKRKKQGGGQRYLLQNQAWQK